MRIITILLSRFWPTGVIIIGGLLLIIYISLGFVYWQQGAQQREHEEEITKLTAIVSRPIQSDKELKAEYEEVNQALAPMTATAAIALVVGIAEESGINTDLGAGKFRVPSAGFSQTQLGGGTYQLISFSNIQVQGDHDNVTAFISDLDSGKTLETMVLTKVNISEVTVSPTGEEGARRAEFRNVAAAVIEMMEALGLSRISNPLSFAGGVATNLMGDDPDTLGIVEGFPDITTTAADRGYSGNMTLRDGYVLYGHDKISTDNTSQFESTSYIDVLRTNYYYTCEADGTVRQFARARVTTATEFLDREESKTETVASVDVVIYTKPEE